MPTESYAQSILRPKARAVPSWSNNNMGRAGNGPLLHLGVLGLSGLSLMNIVFASPPAGHKGSMHLEKHAALDLHPPPAAVLAEPKPAAVFPSSLHHSLGAQQQIDLPAMGTQLRMPNRVQEFARRVHREGLPVARLWENQSALVSLGLNNKGKPGLWIVQKIR
jgi:hypothetical protein